MTAPVRGTQLGVDWNGQMGVDSEIGKQEWNTFMQRRNEMVDNILGRFQLASRLAANGSDPAQSKEAADNAYNRQLFTDNQPNPEPNYEERNKLYGAAQFYGIDNYDKMPLDALQKVVSARRLMVRSDAQDSGGFESLGVNTAGLVTGGAQELVGLAQRLPFIGNVLAKRQAVQDLSQKLSSVNEGLEAGTTEQDLSNYRMLHTAGGMIAYAFPATKAWQLAGLIGEAAPIAAVASRVGAIGRVGAIANAAAQGGTAAALLESGGQQTMDQKLQKIGAGAAFGGAMELVAPALGHIFNKLTGSFGTNAIPTDYIPNGANPAVDVFPGAGQGQAPRVLSGPISDGPLPPEGLSGPSPVPTLPPTTPPQGALGAGVPATPPEPSVAYPALQSPVIPMGNGRAPASRMLQAPYEAPAAPGYSPVDYGVHNHYSNMAAAYRESNPELAASLQQIADQFAPQQVQPNAPFDPRSILTDREGYVPGQMAPQPPQVDFNSAIDQGVYNLAQVKGGKGGGAIAPEAQVSGANVTKQATILESPSLDDMARQPSYDDADVARAAVASNPGGVQVVQNVGDVGKTLRQLAQQQSEGKLMPHTFRVVDITTPEGVTRSDLLVTDGLPITNKRVSQYKDTGMFEGQRATLAGGHEVVIVQPAPSGGFATVRSTSSGLEMAIPADELMPDKTSVVGPEDVGIRDAQSYYNHLRNNVISKVTQQADDAAIPRIGWLDPQMSDVLPQEVENFLNDRGVTSPAARNALKNFFDTQRVRDFQATSPEELTQMQRVNREASFRVTEAKARSLAPPSIDEIAGSKLYRWEPTPGTPGGDLVDIYSQTRFPMDSEQAATTFLKSANREVPDITPNSSVPFETGEYVPGGANPGDDIESPVTTEHHVESGHATIDAVEQHLSEIDQNMAESGMNPEPGPAEAGSAPYEGMDVATANRYRAMSANAYGAAVSPPAPPAPPSPPRSPGGFPPDQPPPFVLPGSANPTPSLGDQFRTVARDKPRELSKLMQSLDGLWLRYGTPFRGAMLKMQGALDALGVDQNKLWVHYNDIVNGVAKSHNQANPWHEQWNDIMSYYPKQLVRDGTVAKIEEIGDPARKLQAMQDAGYTPAMIEAQTKIRPFFDALHGEGGVQNYIFNYVPHIRVRAAQGIENPWNSGALPSDIQFFGDYARQAGIGPRQMDMNVLGHTYVRALHFERNVGDAFNAMRENWNDPNIPTPLRDMVGDWLQIVKTGSSPGYSSVLQGVRQMLNTMGVPVTTGDVAHLENMVLGNVYRAQLGFNLPAFFRDSIQPWFSGTKIGFTPIAKAYTEFLGGGEARNAMWQRALEGGWVEKGQVRVANSDVFGQPSLDISGGNIFTPAEQARRDAVVKVLDSMRDLMPRRYKAGIQGTALDPMKLYTKLGEFNRLISGEAGWQEASKAIADFRAAAPDGYAGDMGSLLSSSKANAYPQPIRDEFQRLVEQGRDHDAANLLANEAANLQMRYGQKEQAIGLRGPAGRIAMMYGNFTQQYIQFMKEGLMDATGPEAVKFALRNATVTGALSLAGATTGWKFSNWMWHQSLMWGGGPGVAAGMNMVHSAGGLAARAMGFNPTPEQLDALQQMTRSNPNGGFISTFNPYNGVLKTGADVGNALNGANPVEAVLRSQMTGENGLGPDFRQWNDRATAVDPTTAQPWTGGNAHTSPQTPVQPFVRDNVRRPAGPLTANDHILQLARPTAPGTGAMY